MVNIFIFKLLNMKKSIYKTSLSRKKLRIYIKHLYNQLTDIKIQYLYALMHLYHIQNYMH